ncbi:MAG TPA: hypothetical protein VK335_16960 [Bryobacteraceae bacterium]|nr:hypothetical protein [Bryobacteraceae bacterium]
MAIALEFCALPYSTRVDELSDRELSYSYSQTISALTIAGEANRQAGEAKERAAAGEKEASRLNKSAEDERIARVNIQRQLEWRSITPEQRRKIKEQLVPAFPTALVQIMAIMGDGEGSEYAEQLADALSPGWAIHIGSISPSGGRLPEGLHIYAAPDNWRSGILQKTLEAAGIEADVRPLQDSPNGMRIGLTHVEIELHIGLRPRSIRH